VTELAAFLGVSAIVIVTPGPDTALTIRSSLMGGRRAGIFTALGVSCGQAVWTLASAVGIAALLAASEPAFLTDQDRGAAYLIWLGLQALAAAVRGPAEGGAPRYGRSSRARPSARASSATSATRRWPRSSRACSRSSRTPFSALLGLGSCSAF
jgi:threonine/homoserine/homoserine lactone efflux protein